MIISWFCALLFLKEGGQTSTLNRTDQTKRDTNVLKFSNESLELGESRERKIWNVLQQMLHTQQAQNQNVVFFRDMC